MPTKQPRSKEAGTAVDRAYAVIRNNIILGKYPGKAHLRETQLARDLGLSRTPVREALRRLSAEGLLVFVSQSGAFVPSWGTDYIIQLYELRAMLEGYCAELAAQRRTAEQLAALRKLHEEMSQIAGIRSAKDDAPLPDRLTELNKDFHIAIMDAAGNEPLKTMTLSCLNQFPPIHRSVHRHDSNTLRTRTQHHAAIVDAIAMSDPVWARAAMCAHITAGKYQWLLRSPEAGEAE